MKTALKTSRFTSLPRILGILLILQILVMTISCSSDDDDKGNGGGNSSSGTSSNIEYGSVTHGGQAYKTVVIGEQTWMAENLNHDVAGSVCYSNVPANCTKYGRLYNWETATTACPQGWHLPSDAEWTQLTVFAGSSDGTKLRAKSGWSYGNGTDDFGFSALPGGEGSSSGSFSLAEYRGKFWSSTESNAYDAYYRDIDCNLPNVFRSDYNKNTLFSVRCVKD
jgi:uncharacterized protein (TIGR02145 family)